jgi:hypothetical protein
MPKPFSFVCPSRLTTFSILSGALCAALLAAAPSSARADAHSSGVRPIGEKPPEPPKVEAGSAITMPGDKPPRPPRLEISGVPIELVPSLVMLRSFTGAFPLGWMATQRWATAAEPPSEPGGIVVPGDKPPKGPR